MLADVAIAICAFHKDGYFQKSHHSCRHQCEALEMEHRANGSLKEVVAYIVELSAAVVDVRACCE